jgi:hypothetical protein
MRRGFSTKQIVLLVVCVMMSGWFVVSIARWSGALEMREPSKLKPVGWSPASNRLSMEFLLCNNDAIVVGTKQISFCNQGTHLYVFDYANGQVRRMTMPDGADFPLEPELMLADQRNLVIVVGRQLFAIDVTNNLVRNLSAPCAAVVQSAPVAIAWRGSSIAVLCESIDEKDHFQLNAFTQVDVSIYGVVAQPVSVGTLTVRANRETYGAIIIEPLYFDGEQWWLLLSIDHELQWSNLQGVTKPVSQFQPTKVESLSAGQVRLHDVENLISANGTFTPFVRRRWGANRLQWSTSESAGLSRIIPQAIDANTESVTIDGTTTTLHYAKSDSLSSTGDRRYLVSVNGATGPAAAVHIDEEDKKESQFQFGLVPIADGQGGIFLTDHVGRFAHVSATGMRLDPIRFRDSSRQLDLSIWKMLVYGWPIVIGGMILFALVRAGAGAKENPLATAVVHRRSKIPDLYFGTRLNTVLLACFAFGLSWLMMISVL